MDPVLLQQQAAQIDQHRGPAFAGGARGQHAAQHRLAALRRHLAEVAGRRGMDRIVHKHLRPGLSRAGRIALRLQQLAQHKTRVDVGRGQRQGRAQLQNGVGRAACGPQRGGGMQPQSDIAWACVDGQQQRSGRRLGLPQRQQRTPTVAMRQHQRWLDRQRRLEGQQCLIGTLQRKQHIAQVVVRASEARLQTHRIPQGLMRTRPVTPPHPQHAQIGGHFGIRWQQRASAGQGVKGIFPKQLLPHRQSLPQRPLIRVVPQQISGLRNHLGMAPGPEKREKVLKCGVSH
mmetsp:Transcript_16916/g.40224  ORF Transcript_16916/g.40224 Transcript_16916/m.40224 type:complete len:288 (-) Transcript_16916:757-1620(-)